MTGLVLAPRGELFESPASWVSRIALSQGVRLREFLRHLPLSSPDIDVEFTRSEVIDALKTLGLDTTQLRVAGRVLANLSGARLDTRRFLLYAGDQPRYRYCPMCLSTKGSTAVPIHWRFACWRICPSHACLMRESCGDCGAQFVLPACMLTAGVKKAGIGFLSLCQNCGGRMSAHPTLSADDIDLQHWEVDFIANGRATLAALYRGEVLTEIRGHRQPLSRLIEFDRRGLLPNNESFLSSDRLARRARGYSDLHNQRASQREGAPPRPMDAA